MRTYELTFIIDAQLAPEKQEDEITKFLDLLKSLEVEILNVEKWGKKRLAYTIGDRQYGYYLMTQFRAKVEILPRIEHYLKLSTSIFRYLILHRDPRTLKLMKQESERLAREALYIAEKEAILPPEEVEVGEVPELDAFVENEDAKNHNDIAEDGQAEKE